MKQARIVLLAICSCWTPLGCDGDDDGTGDGEENEVISRVVLTFTPDGGGEPVVATFDDPDGTGTAPGTSDPIDLTAGATYAMAVEFANSLVDPPEDITPEVQAEAEAHQVFVFGSGVAGPASSSDGAIVTHAYADRESDYGTDATGEDLPVGLANTITADTAGSGVELRIMLRHLPPTNGVPLKVAGLAEDHAAGQPLPGNADVDVRFELTVE